MRETLSSAKGKTLQKLQHLHDQKSQIIPYIRFWLTQAMCCYMLTHVRFLKLGFVLKYKVSTIHTKKIIIKCISW